MDLVIFPEYSHPRHHVRLQGDVRNGLGRARRGDGDFRGSLPQGEGLGRLLAHRRTARGASEEGALQHAHPDERQGRDRAEISQDHALGADRRLVSGQLHLRLRRARRVSRSPDHLRRRQLSGNLARLRDEGRRADRALPGLHVSGQGPADHHGQGDGLGEQLSMSRSPTPPASTASTPISAIRRSSASTAARSANAARKNTASSTRRFRSR